MCGLSTLPFLKTQTSLHVALSWDQILTGRRTWHIGELFSFKVFQKQIEYLHIGSGSTDFHQWGQLQTVHSKYAAMRVSYVNIGNHTSSILKRKTSVPRTTSCSPCGHVKRYLFLNYVLRKITHTGLNDQWVMSCCVEQGILGKDRKHGLWLQLLWGDWHINNYTVTGHKAEWSAITTDRPSALPTPVGSDTNSFPAVSHPLFTKLPLRQIFLSSCGRWQNWGSGRFKCLQS